MVDILSLLDRCRRYRVEPMGQKRASCECCGAETSSAWGFVHQGRGAVASDVVQWTPGASLSEHPANLDLIIGPWGEGTARQDRVAVSAIHFEKDGRLGIMLIDAAERPTSRSSLVARSMRRDEVLNTSLATQAFAMIDAILVGDTRLGHGYGSAAAGRAP